MKLKKFGNCPLCEKLFYSKESAIKHNNRGYHHKERAKIIWNYKLYEK